MSKVDLSIIIVNWNTKDLIKECITSIVQHTRNLTYEIIVVDNYSDDGSVPMIKGDFPSVILIQNEDNRGFAAANNLGMRTAQGKYFLLLNSDTFIDHNAFLEIIDYMDIYPEAGIVGPQIATKELEPYPARLNYMTPMLSFLKIFKISFLYKKLKYNSLKGRKPIAAKAVEGACMFMRRDVIDSVGYLEESFFLYNEEDDFCRRAIGKGWKIIYYPKTYIIHLLGMSTCKNYEIVQLEGYRSDLFYFMKYYSRWISFLLKKGYQITFVLKILESCISVLVPSLKNKSKREITLRWRMLQI